MIIYIVTWLSFAWLFGLELLDFFISYETEAISLTYKLLGGVQTSAQVITVFAVLNVVTGTARVRCFANRG